jgi:predicted nucleotidyltransferase component of viral defense system
MDNVALLSKRERALLFERTAERKHLTLAVVEKDFWVCWALGYLFGKSEFKENLAFKGGTSLSKAYSLINRFSEDIDLALDWQHLNCYHQNSLWEH